MSFEHLLPLVSTLASEIIPDLVREHGGLGVGDQGAANSSKLVSTCNHPCVGKLTEQEILAFAESCCSACLELSSKDLVLYAKDLFSKGLDIETLYLDIIPPSIRRLHDLWEQDLISFLEVTTSTWNIKRLIFALSPEFITPNELTISPGSNRFQALVTCGEGAQHNLGPLIVSQYLQRKGWSVLPGFDHQEKAILELVENNWVDLICVSISLSSQVPNLKNWIAKVKAKSQNSGIQFLLGGPLIALQPDLIDVLGADLICKNVRDVHTLGMKLVSVHRKARKLNQLNALELSHKNYFDMGQTLGKSPNHDWDHQLKQSQKSKSGKKSTREDSKMDASAHWTPQ